MGTESTTVEMKIMNEFDAIKALQRVVDEFGRDTIYTNPMGQRASEMTFIDCFYVHTDDNGDKTAGCLVGKVLENQGVTLEWLRDNEGARPDILANHLRDEGLYDITDAAAKTLRRAQLAQDEGATWGEALYAAKGYVDGRR